MTDAYKCDRCGQFYVDWPALDFDINSLARATGGNVYLAEETCAGWSHRDENAELCPSCAAPAIEWMNEYMNEDSI